MTITKAEIGKKITGSKKNFRLHTQKLSELTMINKITISEIENGCFTRAFYIFEHVLDAVGLHFLSH